jgi:hypothetical protein
MFVATYYSQAIDWSLLILEWRERLVAVSIESAIAQSRLKITRAT